jgi:hypothetical protein
VRPVVGIFVLGACTSEASLLAQSDVFENDRWHSGPTLVAARGGHTATPLPDGSIVVLGGASREPDTSAEVCVTNASSCTKRGELLEHFEQHDAVLLSTGRIFVCGGTWDAAGEFYDPTTGVAEAVPRQYCGAGSRLLPLQDGRAFVFNGAGENWMFDPASSSWQAVSPSPSTHNPATLAQLADGSILVSGDCAICPTASPSADVLSSQGQWRTIAPMLTVRGGHTMTLLRDGRVLVVGGANREDPIGAEVYDPTLDEWITVGDSRTNRLGHSATLLEDGRVLVSGGKIQSLEPSREPTWALFDPIGGMWTFGSDLRWRQYHAAVALTGGAAVVIGGDRGYMDSRSAD